MVVSTSAYVSTRQRTSAYVSIVLAPLGCGVVFLYCNGTGSLDFFALYLIRMRVPTRNRFGDIRLRAYAYEVAYVGSMQLFIPSLTGINPIRDFGIFC